MDYLLIILFVIYFVIGYSFGTPMHEIMQELIIKRNDEGTLGQYDQLIAGLMTFLVSLLWPLIIIWVILKAITK